MPWDRRLEQKRAEATYAEYRRQKPADQEDVDSDSLFGKRKRQSSTGAKLKVDRFNEE
jgi:hypothetical protein